MHSKHKIRRVVPRWRHSWEAARTSEAISLKNPQIDKDSEQKLSEELDFKKLEFSASPSIPVASELMFLAMEAQIPEIAKFAAQAIIDKEKEIGSSQLVKTAKNLLELDTEFKPLLAASDFIKNSKKILQIDYNNPILLMDVARSLTGNQQEHAAKKYVKAALSLGSNSRLILRGANRFYLHIGEIDLAHKILLSSPLLSHDPWVQSAEISTANIRERISPLVSKKIRQLGSLKSGSIQITELASAVATIELISGSNKSAKNLFNLSLQTPNDNSLAQIEWASTRLKLDINEQALKTPLSYEANAENSYKRLRIDESIEFALRWAQDEPFGSRPFDMLCFLSSISGDYKKAYDFAHKAYILDEKKEIGSLTNLLFATIQNKEIDKALDLINRIRTLPDHNLYKPSILANIGAFCYLVGDVDQGRSMYEEAIKNASKIGDKHTESLARAFFARISKEYGDPFSEKIILNQINHIKKMDDPGATYIISQLTNKQDSIALKESVLSKNMVSSWQWDSKNNILRKIDNRN